MKNNRKNRKLKYIRVKNGLRNRTVVFRESMVFSADIPSEIIDDNINSRCEIMSKRYKTPLRVINKAHTQDTIESVKNLITVRFTLAV